MERNDRSFLNFLAVPTHTVLLGMCTQALIAGTMTFLGLVTLNALQQVTASGFFLIIVFLVFIFTRQVYWTMVGMSLQALINTVFDITHIMSLSIMQQYYFIAFYACVLILLWIVPRIKAREDSWDLN